MRKENNLTNLNIRLWKKSLCILLSVIMAFGTFVTMTFGSLSLSDYIDFRNLIIAEAAVIPSVPIFYRHGELVGVYTVNYQDNTKLQYRIGDDGAWTDYSVPFAIPAHKTTKVYARVGTSGRPIYMILSNTNKALGVYTESNTDFEFSYNNINFGYTRTYNSADKNWFESIHSNVLVTDSRLEVTLPDGSKYPMIKNSANTYIDELNGYTLTKTNTDYIFDDGKYKYFFAIKLLQTAALLSAIEDYSGNRLNLNRTTNSDEISISDGAGRTFALSDFKVIDAPDGSNAKYYSVKEITDPNGNKIEYTTKYDRYIQVKDQAGVYLGQYEYMSDTTDHTLIKSNDKSIEYYDNGRLKQITYDNGAWEKYTYDDEKMMYTTLNSTGATTKTVYNDAFLPIEYTKEDGEIIEYTYDDHFRVLTETCGTEKTTYTYDAKGNILSYVTGNSESNTYYIYDSNKRVIREQTGNDYTYYTYDSKGNNLIYAMLKEDYTGEAPAQYDSNLTCFDTTTYTYDNKGRIISEIYSTGGSASYEYNNCGNITKEITVTVENGESTTSVVNYTYDSFGNLLTSSTGNDTSSYIYDAAGRTLFSNENGNYTRIIFDDFGRKIQEISTEDYDESKDGLPESNTYSDSMAGNTYVYDKNGNLSSETNRFGITKNYKYYSTGEKKQEKFDVYELNYLQHGELESVKVAGTNTVSYTYDGNGNLLSENYANGDTIGYEYDDNNNLIKQYHNNDTNPYVTYMYNDNGKLIQKINTDINLKYIYSDNKTDIYKVSDNSLVYSYTETNKEDLKANNDNFNLSISEKHFGQNYYKNITNNSISYSSSNSEILYSYISEDSKKISDNVKFNNSVALSSTYDYDSDMNIIKKEYNNILFEDYYNENGNILSQWIGNDYYNVFEYDSNNQLIFSDSYNLPSEYTYDNRGNILTKYSGTEKDKTFTYNENDVLIAVNDIELTYDEIGNMLTFGDKQFFWNSGRNLEFFCDGTIDCEYSYDENGIRISKTINNVTTHFNTKDGMVISQSDGTDTFYFQYDNDGIPIGFLYNDIQFFYITNQLGDVIAISLFNGEIIANYSYDSWGELISIDLPYDYDLFREIAEANPLRYRGYYYDNESGYYYLQSRYYDPSICRFINTDVYCNTGTKTLISTNRYAYCDNDPVNKTDFDGFWGKSNHYDWTYAVAKECGYYASVAKKIAKNCRALDEVYPSTAYVRNFTFHQEEKEWQYYHFNKYKYGNKDSRTEYANQWLSKAIREHYMGRYDKAYMWLGYALHCLQDIEAHGQIDRGDIVPDHLGNVNGDNRNKADNASGYEWTNSNKNRLKYVRNSKKRQNAAKSITKKYIKNFRAATR